MASSGETQVTSKPASRGAVRIRIRALHQLPVLVLPAPSHQRTCAELGTRHTVCARPVLTQSAALRCAVFSALLARHPEAASQKTPVDGDGDYCTLHLLARAGAPISIMKPVYECFPSAIELGVGNFNFFPLHLAAAGPNSPVVGGGRDTDTGSLNTVRWLLEQYPRAAYEVDRWNKVHATPCRCYTYATLRMRCDVSHRERVVCLLNEATPSAPCGDLPQATHGHPAAVGGEHGRAGELHHLTRNLR